MKPNNDAYNQSQWEFLIGVLDSSVTGLIVIDTDYNIIIWNEWITQHSFINRDIALKKKLFDLFPNLKKSRIYQSVGNALTKGSSSLISYAFNNVPFPLYNTSDKKEIIKQVTYIKSLQISDKKHYCIIQIHDVTAAVKREQQLKSMAHEAKELSRLKSGFVSSVSHELRTPLTSIIGSLGILKSAELSIDPQSRANMLEIAINNAQRLLLLISDILDIEKIESGKMDFKFTLADINELIQQAITDNAGLAEKYRVKFEFKAEKNLPMANIDINRINQVIHNLMSNAAKFEPDDGIVNISTAHADNLLIVSISDHGEGIPQDFQDKVFNQFTQADVSNTKKASGTGLGLAISKRIIDSHNGIIDFETHVGQGTRFYFCLPITT